MVSHVVDGIGIVGLLDCPVEKQYAIIRDIGPLNLVTVYLGRMEVGNGG